MDSLIPILAQAKRIRKYRKSQYTSGLKEEGKLILNFGYSEYVIIASNLPHLDPRWDVYFSDNGERGQWIGAFIRSNDRIVGAGNFPRDSIMDHLQKLLEVFS